ncbi:MAG: glycosyltransferase [Butyrivibrio sp.]|nr:glycosyltransferase [Butyrivibrio sp.]
MNEQLKNCILRASEAENRGNREEAYDAIAEGFALDPRNVELFYMMGIYHAERHPAQALLCLEQAAFLSGRGYGTPEEDLPVIRAAREQLMLHTGVSPRPLDIIIVSYNDKEYMAECLDAIRGEVPLTTALDGPAGSVRVIVVDNASTDGVLEELRAQQDIVLIENAANEGFSRGCNIGFAQARPSADIFLLNNDAILTPNALFWLRMGLCEGPEVGAAGAVSNNATTQMAPFVGSGILMVQNESPDQRHPFQRYLGRAQAGNIPMRHPYEDRARLTGFAVLLRREAVDAVLSEGQLMDERYSPAYFEDDDLGMRLAQAGYRQLLCYNSFIYHYGGKGFGGHQDLMSRSRRIFMDKWGFDIWDYELPMDKPLLMIGDDPRTPIRVLEVGCGMGITLSAIRHRYPYAWTAGIELRSQVAAMGRHLADEILVGDIHTMTLPYAPHSFDYIIVTEVLVQELEGLGPGARSEVLDARLREYLRPDGMILYN